MPKPKNTKPPETDDANGFGFDDSENKGLSPTPSDPGESAPGAVATPEGLGIKIEIPEPEPDDRDRYWIGLTEECPIDSATVGVVTFQKETWGLGLIQKGRPEKTANVPRVGGLCKLSPEMRDFVLQEVARWGIKFQQKPDKIIEGEKIPQIYASAEPMKGGLTPLAYYAWIAPVKADFQPNPGSVTPDTLASPESI